MESVSELLDERLHRLRDVQPPSPKRPVGAATTEEWYSYYAGYADAFVKEIVEALPDATGRVLDPWNGAGTTTSVATAQQLESIGIDLNPAAVLIAHARQLRSDVDASIEALTSAVIASAHRVHVPPLDDDPLCCWFDEPTARRLRALERSIYRLLVSSDHERRLLDRDAFDRVDSLSALFYLGLFRTVRPLVTPFIGSNPTWIKRRIDPQQLLNVPASELDHSFRTAMLTLKDAVSRARNVIEHDIPTMVRLGSSAQMDLEDDSVDAVITSPPYCTRIDYVIATLPELAVLGIRKPEIAALRAQMIGTPVVRGVEGQDASTGTLARFMTDVAAHDSHAAETYYWKFYSSYFEGMKRSFSEIERVTRPGSPVVLVVQDSWFKQLRVPVPEILVEMGERLGWRTLRQHDYPVHTNRAGMHRHARTYRSTTRATETVLIFTSA
jgi:DNA modification methylase